MLAEALAEYREQQLTKVKRCSVGVWVSTLTEEDQEAFKLTLEDKSFSTKDMYNVISKIGANFSMETLRRHRSGECTCQS